MRNFSIKVVDDVGVAQEFTKVALDWRGAFIEAIGFCVERSIQPTLIKIRPTKPVQETV